jgi:hypothetical protein
MRANGLLRYVYLVQCSILTWFKLTCWLTYFVVLYLCCYCGGGGASFSKGLLDFHRFHSVSRIYDDLKTEQRETLGAN